MITRPKVLTEDEKRQVAIVLRAVKDEPKKEKGWKKDIRLR